MLIDLNFFLVISSFKEPLPGFIENLNGVVGVMIAVGKGVLRSLHSIPEYFADVIPVDNVCNGLIASVWDAVENNKFVLILTGDETACINCISEFFSLFIRIHSILQSGLPSCVQSLLIQT